MTILEYDPSLRSACMELFRSNVPRFFAQQEEADFQDFLDRLDQPSDRSDGALYYFVAELNGVPEACGGFAVSPDGMSARFCWGMVRSERHREGIGRELLLFRVRRIRQLFPSSSIALDTTQHSAGFFEKVGFVVTGVTRDFYAPGMDRVDMELRADDVAL